MLSDKQAFEISKALARLDAKVTAAGHEMEEARHPIVIGAMVLAISERLAQLVTIAYNQMNEARQDDV